MPHNGNRRVHTCKDWEVCHGLPQDQNSRVSAAGLNDTKVYIYTYIAISGSLLYCTKETYICSINKNAEDFAQKSKP